MNFFESILNFLNPQMTTPVPYGWFHLLFLGIIITLAIFLAVKYKNSSDKQNKRILLILSVIMLVFEVFKQLNFSYNPGTDVWNYQWYAFPFQFCSVPMYIAFIAAIIKKGKVQESLLAFLGTYGLFAGLAVMLYPNDVFISTIGINIQTMIHHGFMLVIGVYVLASGHVKLQYKTIFKALPVFLAVFLIAFGSNYLTHFLNIPGTFNMFFVSPYFANHLPVLSVIYANSPYPVFLIAYVFGFTFVAFLVLLVAMALGMVKKQLIRNAKLQEIKK